MTDWNAESNRIRDEDEAEDRSRQEDCSSSPTSSSEDDTVLELDPPK